MKLSTFGRLDSSLFHSITADEKKEFSKKNISDVKVWYILCIPCYIIGCSQGNQIEKIFRLIKNVKLIEITVLYTMVLHVATRSLICCKGFPLKYL